MRLLSCSPAALGISFVSENYFEVIESDCETAQTLNSYNGNYIPIVLGENYKRYYDIASVIDETYQVVGFLPPKLSVNISGNYKLTNNTDSVCTLLKYWDKQSFDRAATDICVYAKDEADLLLLLKSEGNRYSLGFVYFLSRKGGVYAAAVSYKVYAVFSCRGGTYHFHRRGAFGKLIQIFPFADLRISN